MIQIIPQRKPPRFITFPEIRVLPIVSSRAISYGVIEKTLLYVNNELLLGFWVKNSRESLGDKYTEGCHDELNHV